MFPVVSLLIESLWSDFFMFSFVTSSNAEQYVAASERLPYHCGTMRYIVLVASITLTFPLFCFSFKTTHHEPSLKYLVYCVYPSLWSHSSLLRERRGYLSSLVYFIYFFVGMFRRSSLAIVFVIPVDFGCFFYLPIIVWNHLFLKLANLAVCVYAKMFFLQTVLCIHRCAKLVKQDICRLHFWEGMHPNL